VALRVNGERRGVGDGDVQVPFSLYCKRHTLHPIFEVRLISPDQRPSAPGGPGDRGRSCSVAAEEVSPSLRARLAANRGCDRRHKGTRDRRGARVSGGG